MVDATPSRAQRRPLVVTFYSYKGGVGRTQALANVAVALANRGRNVIVVDLDLESPGLHTYFSPEDDRNRLLSDRDFAECDGLIEFLNICANLPSEQPQIRPFLVPCGHRFQKRGTLRLLPAGRLDSQYSRRIAEFSWTQFYRHSHGYSFMEMLRDQLLQSDADFVIIDSRTGMTDVGAVCTFQLPAVVVILFALHGQGLAGAKRVKEAILRQASEQTAPSRLEQVLLIPARVDETGEIPSRDEWLRRVRAELAGTDDSTPNVTLLADLDERIPYLSHVAYGEHVIVDPDGEPTDLSRAYEYLATRLDQMAESTAEERPKPSSSNAHYHFQILDSSLASMKEQTQALAAQLQALDPADGSLTAFAGWAHRVQNLQESLCEYVHKINYNTRSLLQEVDKDLPPAFEVADTLRAWQDLLGTIATQIEYTKDTWFAAQQRQVRARLQQAAHGDSKLTDTALRALDPILREGRLHDIEALLPAIEEQLQKDSLEGLLRQNRLEIDILERRLPEQEARRLWVKQRLHRILEGDIPEETQLENQLANLLRLRSTYFDRPEQIDWIAYDTLCPFLMHDERNDLASFETIGQNLWVRSWRHVFDLSWSDSDWSVGVDCREQLLRISKVRSTLLQPIVDTLAQGLISWTSSQRYARLTSLIRNHRNDLALDRAFEQVGRDTSQPPKLRTELLALRLRGATTYPTAIVYSFLQGLLEQSNPGDAFYAMCALAHLGSITLSDKENQEHVASILAAFVAQVLITDSDEQQQAEALLRDREVQEQLRQCPAGHALLAGLAGDLFTKIRTLSLADYFNREILHDPLHAGKLPQAVRDWLRYRETRSAIDTSIAQQLTQLVTDLRDGAEKSIYAKWAGSPHYEDRFKQFWLRQLDSIVTDRRAPEVIASEIAHLDGSDWLDHAIRDVRREVKKYDDPDGSARRNLLQNFDILVDKMQQLNQLRKRNPGLTLKEVLKATEARDAARDALTEILSQDRSSELSRLACASINDLM